MDKNSYFILIMDIIVIFSVAAVVGFIFIFRLGKILWRPCMNTTAQQDAEAHILGTAVLVD